MRKDAELNKQTILEAVRKINGKRVRSPEITELVQDKKLSDSAVKGWLRRLAKEGLIEREGVTTDPRGFIYRVIEQD